MPFVPIIQTYKVEFIGHHATTLTPVVNVMHGRNTGAMTPAYLSSVAAVFENEYNLNLSAWPPQYIHDETRVTDVSSSTGPQVTDTTHAGVAGTGGTLQSSQIAAICKLTSATRGRSFRGRIYFPGISGSAAADTIDPSQVVAIATWITAVQTALNGLTPPSTMVIASRKLGTSEDVTNAFTESLVATQRRRVGR